MKYSRTSVFVYSWASELVTPCARGILQGKNVSALGACVGLNAVATTFVSPQRRPARKNASLFGTGWFWHSSILEQINDGYWGATVFWVSGDRWFQLTILQPRRDSYMNEGWQQIFCICNDSDNEFATSLFLRTWLEEELERRVEENLGT